LDGSVLFAGNLPGASLPALLFDDGTLLYAGNSSLMVRGPQGEERAIAFTGAAAAFSVLGPDWVLIESGNPLTPRGLRLSTGAVFELPEVAR